MASPPREPLIAGLSDRDAGRLVRTEGFLGEVFVSLSSSAFVTGLALWLGAGPLHLGLLVALPFIAQAGQLLAPILERKLQSRRRFVVPAFLIARLLWLVPGTIALMDLHTHEALTLSMAAVFVMALVGMVGVNGWTAWMADLVHPGQRARVFGLRSAAVAAATMTLVPLGSLWLDYCRASGMEGIGHASLAALAALGGCAGSLVLGRLPDAPPQPHIETDTLSVTRRVLQRRRFRRVISLFSVWNLSIGLPAAFWTVYMLQHLRMSFFLIGLHASIILAMRLLTHKSWSRLIDRVGSQRVLIGCGFGAATIPLQWMWPTADNLWPIWVEAVLAGMFWTGFNQAAFVQPISALAPAERSQGLALFNMATGTAMFVASTLGGVVLHAFGTDTKTGFFVLFGLAALIRLFVSMLALRLTDSQATLHGFLFSFVGYGMLREWAIGRGWVPSDDEALQQPPRRRSRLIRQ